ncbi:MAG: hypothetical protein UW19_C0018G0052 [Candidatus Moranbacteria bacterium GW2011_GWF2_44_10]|nr:MAG: hypothetical protein UW19_C0018G0052 [Candidatus Moranbacteria bacterium GW2011_GWF2_44_10]
MESLVRIPQSELNATLERLSKLGVTQEHFKRVRSSRKYAKAVASAFLGDDGVVMSYNDVRTILGQDFITPEEIAIARKLTYGDDVLQYFTETLPSEEVLQWLRDNGFVLIAGPPSPMSLLEVRDLNAQLLYTKSGGWYAEAKQKFSRDDKVVSEWLMLRKGVVPKSTSKTWDEQQKLLSEAECVPNAPETTWGETTYKKVRNTWLFSNIYARTSSVVSVGYRVYVGYSANGGVLVNGYWDDDRYDFLGLASARKRNS